MRLGEIKNIIAKVLDSENKIVVESESLYGDQAFNINKFGELVEALEILSKQSWNDADYSLVSNIRDKYGLVDKLLVTQEEFNQLSAYISNVNQKLPLYFSILDGVVEEQEKQLINIKLPVNTLSFDKLSDLNSKYSKLFKMFQLDAEFSFVGFDKGTDWYMVTTVGILSYNGFIACLHIAQEALKTRTEYYNSEIAKLDYEAGVKSEKNISEEGLTEYQQRRVELIIREEIKKAVDSLESTNGSSKNETNTKLIKATTELIKQLDEGSEFHLSLNPPDYAKEIEGKINIDYKKMPKLGDKKETSKIEAGTSEAPEEISQEDLTNES